MAFDDLRGLPGPQGPLSSKSQKEGQEDQGTLKQLGGGPASSFPLSGPPGLPFGSSLGSLNLPARRYFQGDEGIGPRALAMAPEAPSPGGRGVGAGAEPPPSPAHPLSLIMCTLSGTGAQGPKRASS